MQLLEIPGDPTTLPSEHAERINVLESQIAEKDADPNSRLDGAICCYMFGSAM